MNNYWAQYSIEEIDDMHGVEKEEDEIDVDEDYRPLRSRSRCDECGRCSDCLL